ncbi:MAG: hypothetical protein H0V04_05625 [Chloroflexi bacterium]|nr:hypothetical protein [Chloroflexota bacterium]
MAEIPTFAARQEIDLDGDREVSDAEGAAWRDTQCADVAERLELTAGGQRVPLAVEQRGLSFPQGQGAVTLRLVCVLRGGLATPVDSATPFTFTDPILSERRGWREIVVEGDGTTIEDADAPSVGTSQRLTTYPADLLVLPLEQSSASFVARPGGVQLAAFSVPDALPVAATGPGPNDPPATSAPGPPPAEAAIPGGITELTADLTALFQTRDLTLPVVLLSLLLAAGLGALHALSPGHGKTVMAAYLVGSRGTVRHAIGLGLTVTVSHTFGVLALGALSLSAASFLPPERLYPILGVVSGLIVIAIGVYLVGTRIRLARQRRRAHALADAAARAHAAGPANEDEQAHVHAHEHDLPHEHHDHEEQHDRDHETADDPAGWHEHGGIRHTHLPPAGSSLSWRGLFALGLSGGMVPSVSALILLLGSISLGRPEYGIILTVAFGLGMAAVLVGVGMALVYARGLLERLPDRARSARLGELLPTVTAGVVLVAGILITAQAAIAFR